MEATAPQTTIGPRAGSASLLGPRFFASAVLSAVLVAVLIGVPTDVLPNPWFTRMTPATPENYLFWVASSALTGVLLATYLLPRATTEGIAAASAGSGFLGLLAVGCPVCNKLIVALLGTSGALNYFAPIQPLLGGVGLVLAAVALWVRLRGARAACRLPEWGENGQQPG